MTFAQVLLEVRRRASGLPDDGRRPEAIERIAREILAEIPAGDQVHQVRRIPGQVSRAWCAGDEFDVALLDQMTPELVLRLDMMLAELLELGRNRPKADILAKMKPSTNEESTLSQPSKRKLIR